MENDKGDLVCLINITSFDGFIRSVQMGLRSEQLSEA